MVPLSRAAPTALLPRAFGTKKSSLCRENSFSLFFNTALRRRGCGDPPSAGGGPHGRSPCMDFLPPFRRRFPALLLRVIAVYPMQTVMRFSRCGAGFGNKKSPHNNLNLTIPSGMALVRVCYVAIRKLKTCSGSFGSRAGTLSKYVILNCWNRLPQKLSRVNRNF